MKIFVVFKLQQGEKIHAYSLVDQKTLATIPQDIRYKEKEVKDKLYTKEELEALRDMLLK